MKLYKARHLVEMTVARQPDVLESCFGAFDYYEAVHGDKHDWASDPLSSINAKYGTWSHPDLNHAEVQKLLGWVLRWLGDLLALIHKPPRQT